MVIKNTLIFLAGFLACAILFFAIQSSGIETPLGKNIVSANIAPQDWINEKDIILLDDMIILKVKDATISRYAPTGSMKPVFDKDSNGIRVVPNDKEKIQVGDIISFRKGSDLIVHRVIEKGTDEQGTYFITQGDNNVISDGKVRPSDIEFVTIAVLW